MEIDISKLRSSVKRLSKTRKDRRKSSDLMATIRPLLPEIERMRKDDDALWDVIALGLAEQGVVEGDGKPISEKRLTSAISKIKKQDAQRAAHEAQRLQRSDLGSMRDKQPTRRSVSAASARLAPELTARPQLGKVNLPLSEDEIRRAQYEKHQHLFTKD